MVDLSGSLDSAEKKLPTRISSFKCGKHFSDYPETRFEDNPSMTTCGHKPHGHATRRKKDSFAYKVQVWTSNVPPSASATQRHPAAHSGCRFDDQKSWKKKKNTVAQKRRQAACRTRAANWAVSLRPALPSAFRRFSGIQLIVELIFADFTTSRIK